ncbi:MAG: N-acetyltransferase [Chlorobiaceae bacterium]|nr:N-acetyltransferase [Chlorobiaceae bacterium]
MDIGIFDSTPDDREGMLGIFNHYVVHSFATYTEEPVSMARFEALMSFFPGWPSVTARSVAGAVAGFGLLRPYSMIPAFCGTAELTCFIAQEFTRMGIGAAMLRSLEARALDLGLRTIVATICSLNEGSLRFHDSQGFVESGRLHQVGVRRGVAFDVVFFQKKLQ